MEKHVADDRVDRLADRHPHSVIPVHQRRRDPGQFLKERELEFWGLDKDVAVLRFVYENTNRGEQKLMPWTRLMKLWNQQHPEERFTFMQAFRQACLRAEEWLGIHERS